ncbi:MAG: hypothetical protein HYV04_05975 [Deltaproteobacteria bacterium]|nr:hypothetical protein [Deltaproteobacteria bacterium]
MRKASQFFSEDDRRAIERAVAAAEATTTAEIIPVVATASGRYDRAEDLFGVVFALLALAAAWLGFQDIAAPPGWGGTHEPALGLVSILLIVFFGFVAGAALAARVAVLRLPFITRREMQAEVERSAAAAFQQFRVRGTAGATGILIYISLYERMVRVLGDDAIAARLGQSDWKEVRDLVIRGIREDEPAQGLVCAVEKCGALCTIHFPPQPRDLNELSNALRIID